MAHYVTIGFNDYQTSINFYDKVLATIGYLPMVTYEGYGRAYSKGGKKTGFAIWVLKPHNEQAASFGNGAMVGLETSSQKRVNDFYQAALSLGGTCEGPPGLRELYSPTWYGAYVRDPIGNKLSCFVDKK